MNKMINLIRNENMKLYKKIGTWVMIGILLLAIIGTGAVTKLFDKVTSNANWKDDLRKQNISLQQTITQMGNIKATKDQYTQMIKINDYRIEHDIAPENNKTIWGFVSSCSGIVSFISLFTIIIGAGMVAGEFSEGTIKLLLIRPSKRWKILLSKYISILLSAVLMLALLFVVSFLVGGLFFGFGGATNPYLSYSDGAVKEVSMIGHVFSLYGYNCVDLIMMATFAFMISSVFRNNALAIGLSLFLYFTGGMIVGLLAQYDWVKYILFANTNLRMYSDGTPLVKGMTLGFSIIILIIYYAAFNAISWFGFTKRDVAA